MIDKKKINYLKLELSCSPTHDYLPEYNNVVIESEFEVGDYLTIEHYIGRNLNALLNHHCGGFGNYTVFPFSITNREKVLLLKDLEDLRKETDNTNE